MNDYIFNAADIVLINTIVHALILILIPVIVPINYLLHAFHFFDLNTYIILLDDGLEEKEHFGFMSRIKSLIQYATLFRTNSLVITRNNQYEFHDENLNHTVENHKRNLRHKTKTKTSAELIHYVWSNNLI